MTELASFSLFSKLPLELQLYIWDLAWKNVEPRVFQLIFDSDEQKLTVERKSRCPHVLLQTCSNARASIPCYFKKLSIASGDCILFNPGKDTIYFGEGCDRVNALDLRRGRKHVQNIAFGSWLWSVRPPSQLLVEISRRFPYVQAIRFLNDEHHPSKAIKKSFMETINDLNRRLSLKSRDLRFKSATCVNTNGVTEFADEEDEHKDGDEAGELTATTSSTLLAAVTSFMLPAHATSCMLEGAAAYFTLLVSDSHNEDPLEAKNKCSVAKLVSNRRDETQYILPDDDVAYSSSAVTYLFGDWSCERRFIQ